MLALLDLGSNTSPVQVWFLHIVVDSDEFVRWLR